MPRVSLPPLGAAPIPVVNRIERAFADAIAKEIEEHGPVSKLDLAIALLDSLVILATDTSMGDEELHRALQSVLDARKAN